MGRAASVLRDQSWLSPSLREWIWCQGQGKAAAAAPEHHPPTCSPGKVLLAPGEAPAFHTKSPQSPGTLNTLPRAQSAALARAELTLSTSEISFFQIASDSLKFPSRTHNLTSHFGEVYAYA